MSWSRRLGAASQAKLEAGPMDSRRCHTQDHSDLDEAATIGAELQKLNLFGTRRNSDIASQQLVPVRILLLEAHIYSRYEMYAIQLKMVWSSTETHDSLSESFPIHSS
jgi:hypothetical protein